VIPSVFDRQVAPTVAAPVSRAAEAAASRADHGRRPRLVEARA
jgi:hypothetical protein